MLATPLQWRSNQYRRGNSRAKVLEDAGALTLSDAGVEPGTEAVPRGHYHSCKEEFDHMSATHWLIISLVCGLAAVLYGVASIKWINGLSAGNARMQGDRSAIRAGAKAYLATANRTITIIGLILAVVIGVFLMANCAWLRPRCGSFPGSWFSSA